MKMGTDIFRTLEKIIGESEELKLPLNVSDEGGFSPEFDDDSEALGTIVEAIKVAGYEDNVKVAIDMAATSFCRDGKINISSSI